MDKEEKIHIGFTQPISVRILKILGQELQYRRVPDDYVMESIDITIHLNLGEGGDE